MNLISWTKIDDTWEGAQSCTIFTDYDISGLITGTIIESHASLVQCGGSNLAVFNGWISFEDETCEDAIIEAEDQMVGATTIECVAQETIETFVLVPTATSTTTIVYPEANWFMLSFLGFMVFMGVLSLFKR